MTGMSAMSEMSSDGERREAARSRRWMALMTGMFIFGGLVGFGYGLVEDESTGAIPVWAALGACISFLAATVLSVVYLRRDSDELEVLNNLWALAGAGSMLIVGYPCWYVLWRGGLVPEPSHEIVFGLAYLTLVLIYLWRKYL